jgi:hypothetical protein
MLIVRLFPKMEISKVWDYVESDLIKKAESDGVTPLYATQTEGMMSVGVIFDVTDPDNIADFLTENLAHYDEIHHSKTISFMKTVFFPIPKEKPMQPKRYIIRIYTHARFYKSIYQHLKTFKYQYNKLFPIYLTYSLGEEDIILNVGADSFDTVNDFVKKHIRNLDGALSVSFYPVVRAKRFASLEKLIEFQQKLMTESTLAPEERDSQFDYVEDFEYHCLLTGAFRRDL